MVNSCFRGFRKRSPYSKMSRHFRFAFATVAIALLCSGCRSPYHADQGALAGGLTGAGLGYLIGDATGQEGLGTAIGALAGTAIGGAIGEGFDEQEARNRAMIAEQLGRQVPAGSVSVNDVLEMTRANVDPTVIANHIRNNGMNGPLQSNDLIALSQQNVHPTVIQAMQAPPPARQVQYAQATAPAPVYVQEAVPVYYPAPVYYEHCHHPRYRSGVSWGVSVRH